MKTTSAISATMRNVFSVAKMPPATVTASQMARITPRIVPMIRPMYLVCARLPLARDGLYPPSRPTEPVRAAWHIWPGRRLVTGGHVPASVGHVMTAGPRDPKVNGTAVATQA